VNQKFAHIAKFIAAWSFGIFGCCLVVACVVFIPWAMTKAPFDDTVRKIIPIWTMCFLPAGILTTFLKPDILIKQEDRPMTSIGVVLWYLWETIRLSVAAYNKYYGRITRAALFVAAFMIQELVFSHLSEVRPQAYMNDIGQAWISMIVLSFMATMFFMINLSIWKRGAPAV
jgi:hypothetical protein